MSDEVRRHLDGEVPLDALDADGQREAEAWSRMVDAFRVDAPRGGAPPWLETRVMAEIEALPEPGTPSALMAWLTRPRPVRVSPLAAVLVTAVFAAVLAWPGAPAGPSLVTPASTGAADVIYVQFVLEAPGANSVSVAGDFSDWEALYSLEDIDDDGIWTGRVPVRPGVHGYMFLVDGSEWQTDPRAERYQDDGFGNRNAVLAVAASD